MNGLLLRAAHVATLLAALAAGIALAYTASAWIHDLRAHSGGGHGPGPLGVAAAAAVLALAIGANLGLRRIGSR